MPRPLLQPSCCARAALLLTSVDACDACDVRGSPALCCGVLAATLACVSQVHSLLQLVTRGDVDAAASTLREHSSGDGAEWVRGARDPDTGSTLLHCIVELLGRPECARGAAELLTLALSLKCSATARDNNGATPMHAAVQHASDAVVGGIIQQLQAAGASIAARCELGETPLHRYVDAALYCT